jgi:hypothetical protein
MERSALARPEALLEREHEVEHIHGLLHGVGRRIGAVLAIEGVAGMGKSRLLEEGRTAAPELGVRLLAARATDLEQGSRMGSCASCSSDRC